MRERVEGPGKYIKAKTYLMRMINNTTAMYLNLGLLDFIKIAITYMNIYVFSHNGKKYDISGKLKLPPKSGDITNLSEVRIINVSVVG